MPKNKKHHYVPKFYLKRFSEDNTSISLFNLKNKRKITGASLTNQCKKDYFYGADQIIEHLLGDVETSVAMTLNKITEFNVLPPLFSDEHLMLSFFVLLQHGRTLYAAEEANETADNYFKRLYNSFADENGIDLSKVKFDIKNAAQFSLSITAQAFPLILDLDYKLLVNSTGEEFVTSDNPVVFYNQFMSFRKQFSNAGVACKGLKIFIPIDPTHLILFYDPKIYRVGNYNKESIKITSDRDIYELNNYGLKIHRLLTATESRYGCYLKLQHPRKKI